MRAASSRSIVQQLGRRYRDDLIPASIAAFIDTRGASLVGVYERLTEVVDEWNVVLGETLHGGWNSLVLGARSNGSAVVLKLPAEPGAVAAEAAALDWWGPEIAPRVLRHDARLGALSSGWNQEPICLGPVPKTLRG